MATEITRFRGDTDPFRFKIWENKEAGTPADLSGDSFILTVDTLKNPPDDSTKLFSLTGVMPNPTNGEIFFYPSELNVDLTPGTYYYDIQRTDVGNYIKTLVLDKLVITQDITK